MFYKKIAKKLGLSKNKITGKLERNPRYYHGLSFNKFQMKTSEKSVELDMDEELQKILETCLWQVVSLHGIYLTETIFKVERIENFSEDFSLPPDLAKRYDLQFFQNQISKGLFIQPSYEEIAV